MNPISQQFSATINLARPVNESWRRRAVSVADALDSVSTSLKRLQRNQTTLTVAIREATLAGRNINHLRQRYEAVSDRIKILIRQQQVLNHQMQTTAHLAWFKGKAVALHHAASGVLKRGLIDFRHGLMAMATDMLMAPLTVNQQTAQKAFAARRYGVDIKTYSAWDALASQSGISGANIGAMYAHWRAQTSGHQHRGNQAEWKQALQSLGLNMHQLAAMNSMAQFSQVIARAQAMKDQARAEVVLSTLLGADAPKFLAFIQQSGQRFDKLISQQREYSLVTQAGVEGALLANTAFGNLRSVFNSAVAEFSGLLGKELAPGINAFTKNLAQWFKQGGITKIVNFFKNDLYPNLLTFMNGVVLVGKVIYRLAQKLSWLLPKEPDDKRKIISMVAEGKPLSAIRQQAENSGLSAWFNEKIDQPGVMARIKKEIGQGYAKNLVYGSMYYPYAMPEIRKELVSRQLKKIDGDQGDSSSLRWEAAFASNKSQHRQQASTMGNNTDGSRDTAAQSASPWSGLQQKMAASAPLTRAAVNDNRTSNWQITINTLPGQSPTAIADALYHRATSLSVFNGDNVMYDQGGVW